MKLNQVWFKEEIAKCLSHFRGWLACFLYYKENSYCIITFEFFFVGLSCTWLAATSSWYKDFNLRNCLGYRLKKIHLLLYEVFVQKLKIVVPWFSFLQWVRIEVRSGFSSESQIPFYPRGFSNILPGMISKWEGGMVDLRCNHNWCDLILWDLKHPFNQRNFFPECPIFRYFYKLMHRAKSYLRRLHSVQPWVNS